jgi:hypothetical protein
MLKTTTLVLFLVVASICANAQEKWFRQKISEKVSVNFPVEPKKINDNTYAIKDKDSVVFALTYVDIIKLTGMDIETFNSGIATQAFADGFMNGLTPTMPQYTFAPVKITSIKDYTTYQITGRDDANKRTVFMNVVFVDGIAHSLTCFYFDGQNIKNKDKFLAGEIYINGK